MKTRKKTVALILSLVFVFGLCSCGGKDSGRDEEDKVRRAIEDAINEDPVIKAGLGDEADEAVDDMMDELYSEVTCKFSDGILTVSGSGPIGENDWIPVVSDAIFETDEQFCRDAVEKVIIEDGVTRISNEAFRDCRRLSEITIPDSVAKIGTGAFRGCAGWVVPDSSENNELWPSGALLDDSERMSYLEEKYGFHYTEDVSADVIESALIPVGLTDVTIPDSVTDILSGAFSYCSNLRSITNLTSVPDDVCSGCISLSNVQISDTVTSIQDHAFEGCSSLESLVIPDSVTHIGDCAFSYSGIREFEIPESMVYIGENPFTSSALTKITIPASAVNWNNSSHGGFDYYCYSLFNCESLREITFLGDMELEDIEMALSYPLRSDKLISSYNELGEGEFVTIHAPAGSVIEGYCKRQIEKGTSFLRFSVATEGNGTSSDASDGDSYYGYEGDIDLSGFSYDNLQLYGGSYDGENDTVIYVSVYSSFDEGNILGNVELYDSLGHQAVAKIRDDLEGEGIYTLCYEDSTAMRIKFYQDSAGEYCADIQGLDEIYTSTDQIETYIMTEQYIP
ncbi:MAG: leucine-rich repeat domain-containing protein [Ruminococcus flavefaciens]|nr:leucine-rich repeat domain-containing protein [Ruminococcus flavefaciens]